MNFHPIVKNFPLDLFGNLVKESVETVEEGDNQIILTQTTYEENLILEQIQFLIGLNHPEINIHKLKANLRIEDLKIDTDAPNLLLVSGNSQVTQNILDNGFLRENNIRYIAFNYFDNTPEEIKKLYKGNFSFRETENTIISVQDIYNYSIDSKHCNEIAFLSGGNFSLVKSIIEQISINGSQALDTSFLLLQDEIIRILETILTTTIKANISDLFELGILNLNRTVSSELFKTFLINYKDEKLSTLFKKLTDTDIQILSLLSENPGEVIDKDRISILLNQELCTEESQWAVYKAVERMKKKIDDFVKVETIKGQGWKISKSK